MVGHAASEMDGEARGIVAVGASAGGVEALSKFAAGLPEGLPYAVAMVLHMPSGAPSVLARIIDRSGPLPATRAESDMALQAGHIYVCAPDRHLLVRDRHCILSDGPTENGHRPAINALFRSVALAYGPESIGVLLSGVLDDGVLGLKAITSRNGTTIVQHPDDALYPAMPVNALQAGVAQHQAAAADMGRLLAKLADREIKEVNMERDAKLEIENRIAMGRRFSTAFDTEDLGPPSGYVCPDCNGSLQVIDEATYRCRVGHAWTGEALLQARSEEIEAALRVALSSLQEKSKLARRLAENHGSGALFDKYTVLAEEAEHAMHILSRRLSEAYDDQGERDVS
jgi:two-component system, chemotaxis family, protein-glutamate methylesterase/glutaminase